MANFWLRPGNAFTSNNTVAFIESTLENLGATKVGTFRADSGFYDKAVVSLLKERNVPYIISAKLTHGLQQSILNEPIKSI